MESELGLASLYRTLTYPAIAQGVEDCVTV